MQDIFLTQSLLLCVNYRINVTQHFPWLVLVVVCCFANEGTGALEELSLVTSSHVVLSCTLWQWKKKMFDGHFKEIKCKIFGRNFVA